ncbi:ubiquitin carboxyl-terminal hydrolase 17-like protein E [Cricetulus griseus]|uniref:Ubiquitin carboxyl-terminal hydrolase n=1 Tax=Cricetulus griseus TaxID=10029 RepID=A0A061IGG7_CRIGR|nr:ubiquitin carboxyl-terminal hydrolase 17-like protein E [Cricetulus griseus]ERE87753.1 ubiquitin carboxyl-terminal hydrolase 17-like protein 2 [Cricetulus griseus]
MASTKAVGTEVYLSSCPATDPTLSSPDEPNRPQNEAQVVPELAAKEEFHLSWQRPHDVGAGLENTGNSCYMNAVLQCLTHTPPLVNYMLSREHSQNCCHQGDCMICAMEAHVTRSLLYSGDVIQPSEKLTAAFHKHRQEDAHEFLLFTLNAMHTSCLPGSKLLGCTSEQSSLIHEIFGGSWKSQIKCLHCNETTDLLEPFLDITLDIQTAQSVNQALENLVMEEQLCGENAYHCDNCRQKTMASKTLTVKDAPKVLLLVLNRFSEFTGDKKDRKVSYPESFDFQPYISQSHRQPLFYSLYAVLVHDGVTCHSGHYFCYVKAGNGHWYKMDDSSVTRCDVNSVLSEPAYVLFYVQQTDLRTNLWVLSQAEHQVGESSYTTINRGSPTEAAEPPDHTENTAAKNFLDHWKTLLNMNTKAFGETWKTQTYSESK